MKLGTILCARWLRYCLSIGWKREELDELERIWHIYYDENGRLKRRDLQ